MPPRRRQYGTSTTSTPGRYRAMTTSVVAAPRARATMDDVARLAGVGRATVSRVLNGASCVSVKTRNAVLDAVRASGYILNTHARSLVTRRSGSVVFALSASQEALFDDPQFYTLLRGCLRALSGHGLTLALTVAASTGTHPDVGTLSVAGHVDGVLTLAAHSTQPLITQLVEHGIPVVACGRPMSPDPRTAFVAVDDRAAAACMVRHLSERGRRRIATITAPLDTPAGSDRLAGYHDALGQETDQRLVARAGYTRTSGHDAMRQLLGRVPDLDAVFAASGQSALGALDALHNAGRRVPQDVAVGGFDESTALAESRPALSTMRPAAEHLSTEMVRLLLDLMAGDTPGPVLVPSYLVVRDST